MPKRLSYSPNLTVPAPPRFDAAATAAARPVEPLRQRRFPWIYENIRFAPSHWKLLVLTAIVSLTTGGVGGMLIKDGQQSLGNEQTLNSVSGESQPISSPENVESTGGMIETSATEVTQPSEPRRHTRLRRAARQVAEVSDEDSEDEDKEDRKRKKDDDDDDRDRNHVDDRKRRVADDRDDDDDRRRKDRKLKEDDERGQRSRRAMLYDVLRLRRP